jgi:uncharacterized SAM-binding protein YcdF (DUF218 family)
MSVARSTAKTSGGMNMESVEPPKLNPSSTSTPSPGARILIVVLGGNDQVKRAHAAANLHQHKDESTIFLTGTPSECQEMFHTLLADHMIESDIIVDPRARNTRDNAHFTDLQIRKAPWEHVWVVTSDFQLPRAAFLFRRILNKKRGPLHFVGVNTRQSMKTRMRQAWIEGVKWVFDAYQLFVQNPNWSDE